MRCEHLQAHETRAVGADDGHHIVSRQRIVTARLRRWQDAWLVIFVFANLDLVADGKAVAVAVGKLRRVRGKEADLIDGLHGAQVHLDPGV